jgi:hypothetical protein
VKAALGLKKQRADAEQRARQQEELERRRQEEARRLAETELRWREEKARVERLERLAAMWRRNRELRNLVEELRTAVGPVDADSVLGEWLAWAGEYAERCDPLRVFRKRSGRRLTLYYHGYDHDRVKEEGFTEPAPAPWAAQKNKPSVELTERPPRVSSYPTALKLELAEDLVLPFEWAQESDWFWREFRVPAALLNAALALSDGSRTATDPN